MRGGPLKGWLHICIYIYIYIYDTVVDLAFDDFVAQLDVPEDTLDVEGLPDNMHEHVVQMNSLDDEFDVGFD